MISISSPWPFAYWGIDIVGSFPKAPWKVKFLVVAIDYFTKCVEAEPLATITRKDIIEFFSKKIICRFGIPHTLISDNGTQFANNPFREWCEDLRIN